MSLLEDVKSHYAHDNYPPEGPDLDYVRVDDKWVKGETDTSLVSVEDHDSLRWGTRFVNVYQRKSEFVAVEDVRPATEMQDWGDYGTPEIYEVAPRTETITVVTYEKV